MMTAVILPPAVNPAIIPTPWKNTSHRWKFAHEMVVTAPGVRILTMTGLRNHNCDMTVTEIPGPPV